MNEKELRGVVQRVILTELAKAGEPYVPVMSSNRHVHLCQADVERLFGAGYTLTKLRDLVQPGQFACNERVTLETERGKLTLRVVGPARRETQVEISMTDAVKLGLKAPIRMSGELENSSGCTLVNGERRVAIERGVIVAARHLHLTAEEAKAFGVRDGEAVCLAVDGPRAATLENVIVRSGEGHLMEAHIDKDEANACALADGQLCRVIRKAADGQAVGQCTRLAAVMGAVLGQMGADAREPQAPTAQEKPAAPPKSTMLDLSYESRRLITEDDVRAASAQKVKIIRHAGDAIITPLARDTALAGGIELVAAV